MGTLAGRRQVTVYVEIAFGYSPESDSATWVFTDVTAYVKDPNGLSGVTIQRGQPNESSRATPSRLRVALDNSDGRFTPNNPASPHWPNVKFRTPIRVRLVYGGVSYTRFTGFVHEWPVVWPGGTGKYAVTTLTANGVLRRLAGEPAGRPPLEAAVMSATPAASLYWPLEDPSTSFEVEPLLGDVALGLQFGPSYGGGTNTFAQVDGPPGFGGKVAGLNTQHSLVSPADKYIYPRALEIWMQRYGSGQPVAYVQTAKTTTTVATLSVYHSTNEGEIEMNWDGYPLGTAAPVESYDGWWHVVAVIEGTDTTLALRLYINGKERAYQVIGTTYAEPSPLNYTYVSGGAGVSETAPGIGHIAIWGAVPTAQQIADRWQAGIGGVGETAGARLARIGRQSLVAIAASTAAEPMGAQPHNQNTLGLLNDIAAVEGSPIYERTDAWLELAPRGQQYDQATWLELNLVSGDVSDMSPTWDDQRMANTVKVARPGGTAQTFTDDTSVAAFGVYGETATVNVQTDGAALRRAEWQATTSGDPETMRVPSLTVDLGSNPQLVAQYLAADPLGKQIGLASLPAQAAQGLRSYLLVEGYVERIGKTGWEVTFNCSPADPLNRVFVLESGGELSRLALYYQAVNTTTTATATSLSVKTLGTFPTLTNAGGDLPLWLRNQQTGEIFKVTAVSGTTTPQTLTIVRAEQGTTAKAMTEWDVLELAPDPVLGL